MKPFKTVQKKSQHETSMNFQICIALVFDVSLA